MACFWRSTTRFEASVKGELQHLQHRSAWGRRGAIFSLHGGCIAMAAVWVSASTCGWRDLSSHAVFRITVSFVPCLEPVIRSYELTDTIPAGLRSSTLSRCPKPQTKRSPNTKVSYESYCASGFSVGCVSYSSIPSQHNTESYFFGSCYVLRSVVEGQTASFTRSIY